MKNPTNGNPHRASGAIGFVVQYKVSETFCTSENFCTVERFCAIGVAGKHGKTRAAEDLTG